MRGMRGRTVRRSRGRVLAVSEMDLEACLRYHCSLEGRGMGNEHERGVMGHEEHVCEKHERDQEHERGEGEGSEGQY